MGEPIHSELNLVNLNTVNLITIPNKKPINNAEKWSILRLKMKLSILIFAILSVLVLQTKDIEHSTFKRDDGIRSMSMFDQLLYGFMAMFQKRIDTHSLTKEEANILENLIKIVIMRQKQIAEEERSKPVVYWYSRQGRNYETN